MDQANAAQTAGGARRGRDLEAFLGSARSEFVALAHLLTGSQEVAQDVVHDVFARLLVADLTRVVNLKS